MAPHVGILIYSMYGRTFLLGPFVDELRCKLVSYRGQGRSLGSHPFSPVLSVKTCNSLPIVCLLCLPTRYCQEWVGLVAAVGRWTNLTRTFVPIISGGSYEGWSRGRRQQSHDLPVGYFFG